MHPNATNDTRPEAMGDVPGICELPLTRAVVQYRDLHEMDGSGGRIEDIGLAMVLEGRYAATAESIDLGSGRLKVLDLSTELVVLDWIYGPTLDHVSELVTAAASTGDQDGLRRYTFQLGLRVLERVGFGPLTRPSFLRIGFRDICRDMENITVLRMPIAEDLAAAGGNLYVSSLHLRGGNLVSTIVVYDDNGDLVANLDLEERATVIAALDEDLFMLLESSAGARIAHYSNAVQ